MDATPEIGELRPPDRTLMGPGPSDVHPRVLRSMATPLVGYLDDAMLELMDEISELLRGVFRTDNDWTFPISGTGSAAMEAAFSNLVEPGETVLVPSNGYFGGRMASMARRAGGEVATVDAPWGQPLDPADVRSAFADTDVDVFGFVHAETSTGVRQPDVGGLVDVAHDHDAYAIVDCVTSLSGLEFRADDWGVDAAYSAGQKCLSAPPGTSPLTVSPRAAEKIRARGSEPRSFYLDLELIADYWGDDPSYHHTAPASNFYAFREALRLAAEEGLEARWDRHRAVAGELRDGLEALGLELYADDAFWLPTLNAVRVPDGVDEAAVSSYLLEEHGIEIASGLGDLAGEIWRIGCMGHSARRRNVEFLLAAMEEALAEQGVRA
jgi:alanine-glyoxylate transaminase/serine-glyoxylate transaminase/serine-pyruvate transaminase